MYILYLHSDVSLCSIDSHTAQKSITFVHAPLRPISQTQRVRKYHYDTKYVTAQDTFGKTIHPTAREASGAMRSMRHQPSTVLFILLRSRVELPQLSYIDIPTCAEINLSSCNLVSLGITTTPPSSYFHLSGHRSEQPGSHCETTSAPAGK